MNHRFDSGVLTVFFTGHIDTSNAHIIEKQVFDLLDQYSPATVIVDAEELEYISSSGLRIILKLRQRYKDMKVINASSEVFEILEMTGFTEMMTIEKAYRRFDITGCQVIGKGANGTVYRYDRDTIVKVYRPNADLEEIKRERELSRAAFVLGVPTAIPYDVVKVGDCFGSVFELLDAKSFDEMLIEDASNLDFVVNRSVEVAKILHRTEAPALLPSQKDIAVKWVSVAKDYLEEEEYLKLKKLIDDIPDVKTMLHGDLHIKNIMQQNDETLLIDLDTLSYGHPIFEFAFIFNAYNGFGVVDPGEVERFLGIPSALAYQLFEETLKAYFETDDAEKLKEVEEKAAIIGYLRILRRVIDKGRYGTDIGKATVEACHKKLAVLLPKYDTLVF